MQTTIKTKKISQEQRRIFFEAVILALLLHWLLFVLFDYKPPKKNYSDTHSAGITFMNLANQSPSKRREFLNWLEYNEPSLISAPDAGYNQLNPYIHFRAAQPDKIYQTVLPESPANSLKDFAVLKIQEQSADDSSHNLIFNRFGRVPASPEKAKPSLPEPKFPLIKSNDIVLKLSLSSYLLKDSQKLKAKSMLINYNLEQSKMLPRVVVVDSSGKRDFDMSVLRELSLCIDDISQGRKNFTISIQWRKETSK